MDRDQLRELLDQVRSGEVEVDAAIERMRHLPFEDLGFANVDHHRALRHGIPEVVFGTGKTPDQGSAIVSALSARARNVLVTRASQDAAMRLQIEHSDAEYFCASKAVRKQIVAPAVTGTKAQAPTAPTPQMHQMMMQAMGEVRKRVEESFDYVGDRFAAEARDIHEGRSEERGIDRKSVV